MTEGKCTDTCGWFNYPANTTAGTCNVCPFDSILIPATGVCYSCKNIHDSCLKCDNPTKCTKCGYSTTETTPFAIAVF